MTRALQLQPGRLMVRRRWFHGFFWLTLLGVFVISHGCHGDDDNELSALGEPHRMHCREPGERGAVSPPHAPPESGG